MNQTEKIEIHRHIEELTKLFDKKLIKNDPEIKYQVLLLIDNSPLNQKYKSICINIIKNLKMSQ